MKTWSMFVLSGAICLAAKAEAKEAASEVHEGAMPPAGLPKLSADEETAIYRWALCGTPE